MQDGPTNVSKSYHVRDVSEPRSPKRRDEARVALVAANHDLVTTANTQVILLISPLDLSPA